MLCYAVLCYATDDLAFFRFFLSFFLSSRVTRHGSTYMLVLQWLRWWGPWVGGGLSRSTGVRGNPWESVAVVYRRKRGACVGPVFSRRGHTVTEAVVAALWKARFGRSARYDNLGLVLGGYENDDRQIQESRSIVLSRHD